MSATFEVSKLLKSKYSKLLQLQNIYCIFVTALVLKLLKYKDVNFLQL